MQWLLVRAAFEHAPVLWYMPATTGTLLILPVDIHLLLLCACRGASGSGAADFRNGKLRRPPRAQSSGSGLQSTLREDNQQLSFTDSITNTTNSSEASPRRNWAAG
jgi:hypothetical protein